MIHRTLSKIAFSGDWGRQMRFISGPRQCGKTTLARAQLRATGCEGLYYLWDLRSVRNKQKEETDFLMTRENVPWLLVEAKMSDQPVEKHHLATAEALGKIPVVQVCRQNDVAIVQRESVFRLSANRLFS